ncbi:hypothetical protein FOA43_000292 [Brettanomyces nanus]|uniref:FACT complex subunit n=1 Tax=Eeniella nana TaxID=13502 RepID=A0A875RWT0_EENNA|nr:uncharacterized protein FOA43_000292 [Brettanomyces nanus]QPG72988.1 hypothetical protein FOA43_000292 [Brettanomyces nanus]
MSEVKIDEAAFRRRLHQLQKNLTTSDYFKSVNGLLIMVGSSDDFNPYQKSTILHTWLLGYEFPATGIYITSKKILVVTSVGKAKYLSPLKSSPNGSYTMTILCRNKDPEHNRKLFAEFLEEIQKSGKRIGILPRDHYQGKFMEEWNPIWEGAKAQFDLVDASVGVSKTLELKDEEEQRNLRVASRASTNMMSYFTDEMGRIIDEELKITNSQLVEQIENKIDDVKFFKRMETDKAMKRLGNNFDLNNLDWCYKPIVQSNGKYQLKFSVESNDEKLGGNVIMSSLGMRYKSYCSNVTRTFLIGPTKEMERNYDFLLRLQSKAFSLLKDGAIASEIYKAVADYINKERPDLDSHFLKNMGSLIGIDFRDSNGVISPKNGRRLNEGSVVNLVLGLHDLHDDKQGDYGLMIADTVRITGEEPIILTDSPRLRKFIAFYFDDEDEDTRDDAKVKSEPGTTKIKKEVKRSSDAKITSSANTRVLKAKQRAKQKSSEEDQLQIQREIQKELHERRQKEGLERFNSEAATEDIEKKLVFKKYESYVRESQIPTNVRDLKIHIDSKNQTIILPICGRPVPFHINAYKNGSKNEEGEYTQLRLNFNFPGVSSSRRLELPYETGDDKQFIRSITFRSKDGARMAEVLKKITDMKKEAVKRDTDKREMADVVSQANLVEVNRPRRLDNVFLRPTPDSKRFAGYVAIHQNGIRYQSFGRGDHRVNVLFSNIKHIFFQSCKGELLVIIHCHLKTPIMIGKKKTYNVQFYREATDASIDETGSRKRRYRYGDEDELEQEQEERRRRAALDKEFKQFAEHIADASHGLLDLDVPFRELGFQGVPSRSAVLCVPTRDCLVQLVDLPFLVITLEEVEIAHLERVQFGLKNFDLVFVFKDLGKPVAHISTIPMETLEDVKAWLTDVDIPYSEGAVNLNWPTIMKTIQADPYQFFVDGGWSFLSSESDSESDGEESAAEPDFAPSDEDPQDDDEEDYSDADDADADDDESDFDDGDDDDDGDADDDSNLAESDNISDEVFDD